MEFNKNKDVILSLAYSDIKNNIPNYIIINPNNEMLSINYNFIYLENQSNNSIIIPVSNNDIINQNYIYIDRRLFTIFWLIIIFISVITILLFSVLKFY